MQWVRTVWHWARWPLAVLVVGFIALVAWRIQVLNKQEKTAEAVAAIHANRLTHNDVYGPLPVEPDPAQNNATLAGVDVDSDGIRDDVQRAIYFKYQHSAKEAAAAYQYAKALQMEFTHVYNSETLVAVIQEESRAFRCVEKDENYIEDLVFNTETRKKAQEVIYSEYMTSYSLPNTSEVCDVLL